MAENVHKRKAREVGTVCAADHDGITTEVSRQAESFPGLEATRIIHRALQESYDELYSSQCNILDFLE